ncbi:MAG: mercury resistance system periplasmic binding protein MerP [Thiobacillus sp.]|nr:mercury resistance system periplasmic binding protein MerP [Thiobacillus sp.]
MQSRIPLATLLAILASPAFAAPQTVILAVPGMSCAACPITVKKALTRVDGVTRAEVDYDKRQVIVSFDDAKADVAKLMQATADAGYPSTLSGAAR